MCKDFWVFLALKSNILLLYFHAILLVVRLNIIINSKQICKEKIVPDNSQSVELCPISTMGKTELYSFGLPHKNTLFLQALWTQWDSAFAYRWIRHHACCKQLAEAAVKPCYQYKCLADRYKCSPCIKKILKHLMAQAYW